MVIDAVRTAAVNTAAARAVPAAVADADASAATASALVEAAAATCTATLIAADAFSTNRLAKILTALTALSDMLSELTNDVVIISCGVQSSGSGGKSSSARAEVAFMLCLLRAK
jgi:hypothetical protein